MEYAWNNPSWASGKDLHLTRSCLEARRCEEEFSFGFLASHVNIFPSSLAVGVNFNTLTVEPRGLSYGY